ncbi:MAG: hypothetical protein ACJA01_004494 [Saprospiraceae bacterium]|jgi:hypothetical protein
MLKKIIRVITILLALFLIGYIVVLKWPQASVKSKATDVKIAAESIYEAFNTDEKAAESQYLGKVVQVTGLIDEIYIDENNAPVIILRGKSGDPVGVVTLEPSETSKISEYKEGQEIVVKTLCSGMLMEVTFNQGIIIDK